MSKIKGMLNKYCKLLGFKLYYAIDHMQVNPSKFQATATIRNRKVIITNMPIIEGDVEIEISMYVKLLGMYIDFHLNFYHHVRKRNKFALNKSWAGGGDQLLLHECKHCPHMLVGQKGRHFCENETTCSTDYER